MSIKGMNADGTWSECTAKPENRGRYNCHHVYGHLDGVDAMTLDAIAEDVARFNDSGKSTGSLSKKKPSRSSYTRKNTISNNGDAAEIISNIDIITGEAVFDSSMPYRPEDVEFIEIQGVDDSGKHWTMQIYKNGDIIRKGDIAWEDTTSHVDLGELRQLSSMMKQTLLDNTASLSEIQNQIQNLKYETHNYKKTKRKLDAIDQDRVKNLSASQEDVRNDKNKNLTMAAQRVSSLLGIPGGRLMKSLGEKADVKVGIKTDTMDPIDRVSTKSWFGNSNPSLHSAGSRAAEIGFIGMLPEDLRSDPVKLKRLLDRINTMTSDPEKKRALVEAGIDFNKNNAIIMSGDFAESLDLISAEHKVDARGGMIGACWQYIDSDENDKDKTRISSLPDGEREGFLAVAYTLGAAEYNPGEGVYDPKGPKIHTFAEVDDKSKDQDGNKIAHTVLKNRDREAEKKFLLEQASISTSNYKPNQNKSSNSKTGKAKIRVVGNAIIFPVNLSIQLRHEPSASTKRKTSNDQMSVQNDEFVCSECFLVKHKSQLAYMSSNGPVCKDCA